MSAFHLYAQTDEMRTPLVQITFPMHICIFVCKSICICIALLGPEVSAFQLYTHTNEMRTPLLHGFESIDSNPFESIESNPGGVGEGCKSSVLYICMYIYM